MSEAPGPMTPKQALETVLELAEQNILDVDEAFGDETLLAEIDRQREAVQIVTDYFLAGL